MSARCVRNEASDSEEEIETAFNGLQVASEGSSVDKGSTSEAQGRRTDSKHSKGLDLDAPLTPEELSSVARVDLWGNIIGIIRSLTSRADMHGFTRMFLMIYESL